MKIKNWLGNGNGDRLILWAIIVIFVLLPFTTPITVFLGSHLNHLSLFKVWKEITMIIVAALILVSGAYKRLADKKDRGLQILLWLIGAYCGWTLLLGLLNLSLFHQINWQAFIYAVIVNLRFLLFFLLCWLMAQRSEFLQTRWQKLLLIPATVVVVFGLLQVFILPPNVLEHIGYGQHTITAYQTVDQNPNYIRIQSTLRGPNPLGAYLIIIIAALVIGLKKKSWGLLALLAGAVIVLFNTYSRSAWLGVGTALVVLTYVSISSSRVRRVLALVGMAGVLVLSVLVFVGRNNHIVQKTFFHTDGTSASPQSSNAQRTGAIERGLYDVIHEPFGRGPGSAGPASLRNNHPERIAENYYLQIGQEVGWIGLLLFLAINAQVALLLWYRRLHSLSRILLASLAGITLVNLLSHAWTDETLSLVWWGLAGIALASFLPEMTRTAPRKQLRKQPVRSSIWFKMRR